MEKLNPVSIRPSHVVIAFLSIVIFTLSHGTQSIAREDTDLTAGKIIHLEGEVYIISEDGQTRSKAVPQMVLKQGEMVRTGETGWAALILSDESIIQMNNNSLLILKKVAKRAGWFKKTGTGSGEPGKSEYIIKKGHIWLRNKNKNQKIDIKTPYVSTSIRGTELDIRLVNGHSTRIMVIEGRIAARGETDAMQVNALEQVIARPGRPLDKEIVFNPENAVQWTISMNPFIHMIPGIETKNSPLSSPQSMLNAGIDQALKRDYTASRKSIDSVLSKWPEFGPGWAFSSLLYLIAENNTEKALEAIDNALRLMPESPYPLLIKALIQQAEFDLNRALDTTEQALLLDRDNPDLLLNQAKLHFANGYSGKALKTVNHLIDLDPFNSQACNLKGFLQLAMSHIKECIASFRTAIRLNPYLGEAHLGLALALMEKGYKEIAFEEISTAVLLEPQRSVFLSYWAKMLYEDKRFQKAEDILNEAKRLDPKDPTPYLYLAFIYKDLHRAHDSVYSLKQAIELNDNRAVYRSRFLLDKDLAVKNVHLALIYHDLGISEWGTLTAMKAVKQDYNNSAANKFLAYQLEYLHGAASLAARSAMLKAFLLQPANVNTFNSFNEYTSFFEQPRINGTLIGSIGNMNYNDGFIGLYGALPDLQLAFKFTGRKYKSDGWQTHDWQKYQGYSGAIRWDITHNSTVLVKAGNSDEKTGDLYSQTDFDTLPDPENTSGSDFANISAGYVWHASPDADFIFHIKREYKYKREVATHLTGTGSAFISPYAFDYEYNYHKYEWLEDPYTLIQALQFLRHGNHQFSFGGMWYESDRDYRFSDVTDIAYYWEGTDIFAFNTSTPAGITSSRVKSQQSYYLQDIWNPSDKLTFEAAIYMDRIENVNSAENLVYDDQFYNPRLGAIFKPTRYDTFHLSYLKYLQPFDTVERIDAIDVAGHVLPSWYEGALIKEYAASYEREWRSGMFQLKLFKNEPALSYSAYENNIAARKEMENEYRGIETAINQLLLKDLGFSAGYTFFKIENDDITPLLEGDNRWGWARLTMVHRSGITAAIAVSNYDTDYKDSSMKDENIWISASFIEYEFPYKRGKIRFEAQNLFDKHFSGVPLSDIAGILPQRTYALIMEINF